MTTVSREGCLGGEGKKTDECALFSSTRESTLKIKFGKESAGSEGGKEKKVIVRFPWSEQDQSEGGAATEKGNEVVFKGARWPVKGKKRQTVEAVPAIEV